MLLLGCCRMDQVAVEKVLEMCVVLNPVYGAFHRCWRRCVALYPIYGAFQTK